MPHLSRPSGLFHYWCLLWMLTFHLVFEAELHATVALDDYLIHQCHEHSQFKACEPFLFFQHMEEYLDAPPTFCLIFFLLSNGLNFLAEPCVLGEQRLVILFEYAASDSVMNHSFYVPVCSRSTNKDCSFCLREDNKFFSSKKRS